MSDLADRIAAKRREIEASGRAQWDYAKPEDIKDEPPSKPCPVCGAPMELHRASEGAMIGTPYFPKYPLRGAELPVKERPASFWACACDHCEEAVGV